MPPARQHTRNLALSLAFVGLLGTVLALFASVCLSQREVLPARDVSMFWQVMGRQPHRFKNPWLSRLLSGQFQSTLEEAAADSLLATDGWLPAYARTQILYSRSALAPLPDPWAPVVPMGWDVVAVSDGERLCRLPHLRRPGDRDLMAERADYYGRLASTHPSVRIFVVPIVAAGEWLAESDAYFGGMGDLLVGCTYVREFGRALAPEIGYAWALDGFAPAAAMAMHYRSDHHLNVRGAYTVYRQLHALLGGEDGLLGPPFEPQGWFSLPGVEFRGSLARRALVCNGVWDRIEDVHLELPPMTMMINGRSVEPDAGGAYRWRVEPGGRFQNYYGEYFGHDRGLITYSCASGADRVLLVLNDSFDNSLAPILAAHYRTAYFVDLRHYGRDVGEDFDLDEFMRDHGVDDLLFLGNQSRVLGLLPSPQE